jgi:hypothetical protein
MKVLIFSAIKFQKKFEIVRKFGAEKTKHNTYYEVNEYRVQKWGNDMK